MNIIVRDGPEGPVVAKGRLEKGRVILVTAMGQDCTYGSPKDLLCAYPPSRYWVTSELDGKDKHEVTRCQNEQ